MKKRLKLEHLSFDLIRLLQLALPVKLTTRKKTARVDRTTPAQVQL